MFARSPGHEKNEGDTSRCQKRGDAVGKGETDIIDEKADKEGHEGADAEHDGHINAVHKRRVVGFGVLNSREQYRHRRENEKTQAYEKRYGKTAFC